MFTTYIAIFIGGGFGSVMRVLLSMFISHYAKGSFPWGILSVNIIGCFCMGMFVELIALKFSASLSLVRFVIMGFLGGFTTFSAFALETVLMLQKDQYLQMSIYIVLSVFGAILALILAKQVVQFVV